VNWAPAEQQRLEAKLLGALALHYGEDHPIGMAELQEAVFETPVIHRINDTRNVRLLVASLRFKGWWICSSTRRDRPGYFLARNKEEFRRFAKPYRERHLQGLGQLAGMMRLGLPEYLGQLQLELMDGGQDVVKI